MCQHCMLGLPAMPVIVVSIISPTPVAVLIPARLPPLPAVLPASFPVILLPISPTRPRPLTIISLSISAMSVVIVIMSAMSQPGCKLMYIANVSCKAGNSHHPPSAYLSHACSHPHHTCNESKITSHGRSKTGLQAAVCPLLTQSRIT